MEPPPKSRPQKSGFWEVDFYKNLRQQDQVQSAETGSLAYGETT